MIFGVAACWPRVRGTGSSVHSIPAGTFFPGVDGTLAHDGGQGRESGSVQRAGWPPGELRRDVMGRNLLSPGRSVDSRQGRGFRRVLPRVGAVAAIVGGSVMVVHQVWDDREPGIEVGVVSSALHTTWVTLLFVAFAGLGALQRSAFGRLGRVGTVLAVGGFRRDRGARGFRDLQSRSLAARFGRRPACRVSGSHLRVDGVLHRRGAAVRVGHDARSGPALVGRCSADCRRCC